MTASMQVSLTPTASKARERHNAFAAKIAAAAEALAESKRPKAVPVMAPTPIAPEAMPAETDPPPVVVAEPPPRAYPTISAIQAETAPYFNVTVVDLKSHRRGRDVVRPRQVAMYLCRCLTLHSLPMIGRQFGGRDHTTVIHAVEKISGLLPLDSDLAFQVAHLFNVITGEPQ